jgi:molecular chaperone GrpE
MPNSHGNDGERAVEQPAGDAVAAAGPAAGPTVEELEARYAELDDRYKRAVAGLDNYRKRAGQDVERRVAEERERLARDWLTAVDSVERALQMGEPENPLSQGLRAVLEQMEAILERQGVRRVGTAGDRFDPELHEAVAVRTTDEQPDRTIVEVQRSGYAMGDRVLRPARVVVSQHGEREG